MKLIPKYQKGTNKGGIVKFGLYGGMPQEKGRTPEWDDEEDAIFNDSEDENYLRSKGYTVNKQGNYYLDRNGKYFPGIIYHNNNTWNHYILDYNGIKGWDMHNLSDEQKQLLSDLGLDYDKFYISKPDPRKQPNPELIKAKLPQANYQVGNSTITYSNQFNAPLPTTEEELENYMNYGTYHVTDPDKGYDFNIQRGLYRDGGSKHLRFIGTYPEEWKQYNGQIFRKAFDDNDEKAEQVRNALNDLLKDYQIQFDKGGGLISKHKFGNRIRKGQEGLEFNPESFIAKLYNPLQNNKKLELLYRKQLTPPITYPKPTREIIYKGNSLDLELINKTKQQAANQTLRNIERYIQDRERVNAENLEKLRTQSKRFYK